MVLEQVPIVAPVRQKKIEVEERQALTTAYPPESLAMLMTNPELIRNVAIVGHLHHGKTLVGSQHLCHRPVPVITALHIVWLLSFKVRVLLCILLPRGTCA